MLCRHVYCTGLCGACNEWKYQAIQSMPHDAAPWPFVRTPSTPFTHTYPHTTTPASNTPVHTPTHPPPMSTMMSPIPSALTYPHTTTPATNTPVHTSAHLPRAFRARYSDERDDALNLIHTYIPSHTPVHTPTHLPRAFRARSSDERDDARLAAAAWQCATQQCRAHLQGQVTTP